MTTYAALLSRSRIADQNFFLLIDPLADCDDDLPVHPDALLQRFPSDAVETVLRADLAYAPSICPKLITLADAGHPFDEDLVRLTVDAALAEPIGAKRLICGWLSSPSPLDELAHDLAQRCLVTGAQGQRFIPLFEPLRLELLATCLQDRVPPWLWPVSQWILPSCGGLLQLCGKAARPAAPLSAPDIATQHLAPLVGSVLSAWQRLAAQPMPHAVRGFAPRLRDDGGPANQAVAKVLSSLQRSHALGLRNAQDRMTFALQHLTVHARLETHPHIQQRIHDAVSGKTSLEASLARMSDGEWHYILNTLARERS